MFVYVRVYKRVVPVWSALHVTPLNALETSSSLHIPELDVLLGLELGNGDLQTPQIWASCLHTKQTEVQEAEEDTEKGGERERVFGLVVIHCVDAMQLKAL